MAYLTDAQRTSVVERVAARVAGRVPVMVGTADLTASRVADQAKRVIDAGADAIVATAPFYALNSTSEVAEHYRIIAQAVDVPVIAYDVPVRVHSKLSRDALIKLGREGVIAGVKDSSGDDVAFRRLVLANRAAGNPLEISTGHEVMVDAMALLGADGAVPGLANVDPAGYVRLWQAAQTGDWTAARIEQERLCQLFEIAFVPSGRSGDAAGIGAFKAALAAMGVIDSASMPAPLEPLTDQHVQAIAQIVESVGLGHVRAA